MTFWSGTRMRRRRHSLLDHRLAEHSFAPAQTAGYKFAGIHVVQPPRMIFAMVYLYGHNPGRLNRTEAINADNILH